MKKIAFVVLSIAAVSAFAAKPVTSGDDLPSRGTSNVLKIATGPNGKGYSKLFADLKAVCGDMALTEVKTTGGLDNLNVLSNKKADVGIAQLDTIKDMAPGDENIQALKAVAVLNYNYLHTLTAAAGYSFKGERKWGGLKEGDTHVYTIRKFSELKGKTVALVGSAQLMAVSMQRSVLKDYNMRFINAASDAEAAKLVTSGQAQAMMTVSGAPHGWISGLTAANNLTLVPFDEDIGGLYVVRKLNYKNINIYNLKAPAVPNVLLARDFGGKKADQVGALFSCISANLQELKDGEYEPAWNEMKLDAQVDLPKFRK